MRLIPPAATCRPPGRRLDRQPAHALIWLLRAAGRPLGLYAAASTAYVLTLTAAALAGRRPPRRAAEPLPRFDLVIPAHNEAATLPRLLESIARLDYPADLRRVHVVADNCSDATAAVARATGAMVHERVDQEHIGKGYALAFGIAAALRCPGGLDDGVVIVDADSELAGDFLRLLAAELQAGARAIQTYYSVRNADDSAVAMLRYVALCLYHYLRPLGRSRLHLSAGLRGNGMCFARSVAALGWSAHGLTEDVEQHFRLLEQGIHVAFAPEAVVRAEMPVTLAGAAVQNRRWERGRLAALAVEAPRFLALAARRRDASAPGCWHASAACSASHAGSHCSGWAALSGKRSMCRWACAWPARRRRRTARC